MVQVILCEPIYAYSWKTSLFIPIVQSLWTGNHEWKQKLRISQSDVQHSGRKQHEVIENVILLQIVEKGFLLTIQIPLKYYIVRLPNFSFTLWMYLTCRALFSPLLSPSILQTIKSNKKFFMTFYCNYNWKGKKYIIFYNWKLTSFSVFFMCLNVNLYLLSVCLLTQKCCEFLN